MNKLKKDSSYTNQTFEDIRHIDENGIEYWYARELMKILEYKQWRRFENVIDKAKQTCENSDISTFEHFANVGKLSKRANNAEVEIKDYKLTRYACYLIAKICHWWQILKTIFFEILRKSKNNGIIVTLIRYIIKLGGFTIEKSYFIATRKN